MNKPVLSSNAAIKLLKSRRTWLDRSSKNISGCILCKIWLKVFRDYREEKENLRLN